LGVGKERHRLGLDRHRSDVLRVDVPRCAQFRRLVQQVDRLGGFREYDLYDADLRFSHQFLLAHRTFPLARTDGQSLAPRDGQWDQEYALPPLRAAELVVEVDAPPGMPPAEQHAVRAASLDGQRFEGDERSVLRSLQRALDRQDPDVLVTHGGDRFVLRYLRHRAAQHRTKLQLGRLPDPEEPAKKERSFWTYGRLRYRPQSEVLRGRIHLDSEASFFHAEAGLDGLVDLARISSVPIQELARLEAGTAVTGIQIDKAKREGRLVPYKKNVAESPKTDLDLLASDKGGYIFDPAVGVHGPVVELDFSSMYPNIMVTRNVSPETINCACCPGLNPVPQIGFHTCRRSGFIGRSLKPLVDRRQAFKDRMKRTADPDERARLQAACDAMKWLCVCSFGYMGYRNARFGRIECHEAICAWGRELLLSAAELAREHGFEVVHGIVDSVWLSPTRPGADAEAFARAAGERIGIPLGLEGWYDWIVFLPTREAARHGSDAGALNRFYGAFRERPSKKARSNSGQRADHLDGGRIKVRGIEMRQRSSCGVVRRAQERFLLEAGKARNQEQFLERLPDALRAVRPVLRELREGSVPARDLLILNMVGQEVERYRSNTLARCALLGLKAAGVRVPPGDSVAYVVTDAQATRPRERCVEARLLKGDEAYDPAHYAKLVLRGVESMTLPFGWTMERLTPFLAGAARAPPSACRAAGAG
ncbi:MAG: hypothetical protein LC624_01230, partial [Halobacteriales archaeon]|nr:hypothetical protein [Halobacteriales archaeon]